MSTSWHTLWSLIFQIHVQYDLTVKIMSCCLIEFNIVYRSQKLGNVWMTGGLGHTIIIQARLTKRFEFYQSLIHTAWHTTTRFPRPAYAPTRQTYTLRVHKTATHRPTLHPVAFNKPDPTSPTDSLYLSTTNEYLSDLPSVPKSFHSLAHSKPITRLRYGTGEGDLCCSSS